MIPLGPTLPCAGPDAHLWDHTLDRRETSQARARRLHTAVSRCRHCQVRADCLQTRTIRDDGVWGGELFQAGRQRPVRMPPKPVDVPPAKTLTRWDCHHCGGKYEPRGSRSRYCTACRPLVRRENSRLATARARQRKARQDQEVAA